MDYSEATFGSLKKYEDQTLALLASAVQAPSLRDEDILRKRAERVAGIAAQEQQPGYIATVTFAKSLFGDAPYSHTVNGSAESLTRLTPADVRDFYRTHYKTGSAVIAVVGDVTASEIKAKLEKAFAAHCGSVPAQKFPPVPPISPGVHLTLIGRNVTQATIVMGVLAVARSDPDYYPLQVMNYILGGGDSASRLMRTVRSRAGLAYSIMTDLAITEFTGSQPFLKSNRGI